MFTRIKVLGLAANRLFGDPRMLQDAPKLAEKELKGKNVTHAAKSAPQSIPNDVSLLHDP
jgi:hypothetical protein